MFRVFGVRAWGLGFRVLAFRFPITLASYLLKMKGFGFRGSVSGVLWRMKSPTAKHMKNKVETAMILEYRVYSPLK